MAKDEAGEGEECEEGGEKEEEKVVEYHRRVFSIHLQREGSLSFRSL
jgi:hypothetical protein